MKKTYLLLPALLLAGCRSEQVALQAPPAAPLVASSPAALPQPTASELTALLVVSAPKGVATLPAPHPSRRNRAAQAEAPVAPGSLVTPAGSLAAPTARPRQLARLLRRPRTTHGAAESGLGGIGVFAIVVVLALLAGLGALVSFIPGVSFFGGVGLVVAGLLVIGLLFKLFGFKKKR